MWYILAAVVTVLGLLIHYLTTRKYDYWKKKNIPHLKPKFLFGNYEDLMILKTNLGSQVQKICQNFKDAPLIGAYFGTEPVLIVNDPELVKLVTTKDFYYFAYREISDHYYKENLTKNLFHSSGDYWKVLRQNLTPMFSSAKMKSMFALIENCSKTLEKVLDEWVATSPVLEVRSHVGRFTMDCIGSCAFGLDTKAMIDENSAFTNVGNLIFQNTTPRGLKNNTRYIWPKIFYALGLTVFPKEIDAFFRKFLMGVLYERRGKPLARKDFIEMVLSFYNKKCITGDSLKNLKSDERLKVDLEVDDELVVAQCFIFFAAGYETSATTSSYTLYELAKDQESQERARQEVRDWLRKREGQLGYECVTDLPFLEQCIDETLRLYPVLGVVTREVTDTYQFDNGPTVERGLRVHLPIYHMHHNPKYFPDPESFRPERFAPENKHNIQPYTYFPFGEGPRICIGMRFAKMQMLAGLVTILKKYRVELAEGMPKTVEFEPRSVVTQSKTGINLKFVPLPDAEEYVFK
ncbi:Cytochrome P450 6B7 [Eumeta japonica]|uniref:unspecific monooxygenase n=1 Tax=Eumeta variegata TaxID=151549 RepID=A0A4C1TUU5_EUMVA|nr:Cytochrome P450 6B7 [Eumeta japonica]